MRVECEIEECDVEADDGSGRDIPGVCATCSRCGHETTAYGTGEKSINRALVTLQEECPQDEENFYAAKEDGGESRMPDPIVKPWWEKS
jgi:hypothetical protein